MFFHVVVVEPEPIRLKGIVAALEQEPAFRVIGLGKSLTDALQTVPPTCTSLDVLVINIDQQFGTCIKSWAILRSSLPSIRVVALTEGSDRKVITTALAVGISALHPFNLEPHILRRAARNAAAGVVDYDHEIIQSIKIYLADDDYESVIRVGGLSIDLDQQEVSLWGKEIQLSPLEIKVLKYLAQRPSESISSSELLKEIWRASYEAGGTNDQVKSCIKRLRKKIEPDPNHPRYLITVPGQGYKLSDPISKIC